MIACLYLLYIRRSKLSPFQRSPGANIFFDHGAGPEPQRQLRSQFVGLRGTLDGPVLQRTVPPATNFTELACMYGAVSALRAARLSGGKIRGAGVNS